MYDRTTVSNREFRRGFFEFVLPSPQAAVVQRAILVFSKPGSVAFVEMIRSDYRVGFYPDADLEIESSDYDLAVTPIGEFSEESNEPYRAELDVTTIVRERAGEVVGFRIQLADDPDLQVYGSLGNGWGGRDYAYPVHIEIEYENGDAVLPLVTGTVGRLPGGLYRVLQDWIWTDTGHMESPAQDDRALVEFDLPQFVGRVDRARIFVPLSLGGAIMPPPGPHQLLWYDDVDGAITSEDYLREAVNLGPLAFEDIPREQQFVMDITHIIRKHRGRSLGFRIERLSGRGTDFGSRTYSGRCPWIEIETGPPTRLAAGSSLRVGQNSLGISVDALGRQNVKYEVPAPSQVQLEVFDVRGRLVETLVRQPQPAGTHTVSWDPRSRASGMYFYRLMIDREVVNHRSVILH